MIAGGTGGIGEATVQLFADECASVVFSGRSEEKCQVLAVRVGADAVHEKAGVMSEADIKNTIDIALEKSGGLDILFNIAGGPTNGAVTEAPPKRSDMPGDCRVRARCSVSNTRRRP